MFARIMKTKTILLITCHPLSKGGISTWVRSLEKYISARSDIRTLYLYPSYNSKDRKQKTKKIFFKRIIDGIILSIKNYKRLKKILRDNKVDLVHITTSAEFALFRDALFIKEIKRRNIPIVYHLHFGRIVKIYNSNSYEKRMLNIIFKKVDSIITIDKTSYDYLKTHKLFANKVDILPNSIEVEPLNQIVQSGKEVVFIGWVKKEKGIEELLEAWSKIKNINGWLLRIIGPSKKSYLNFIKKNYVSTNVAIEGEKAHDEAMQYLQNSSILVLPSYTEGFPYVILEAMALHKAIISTSVGAIPEIVGDDCGIVISPKNVEQLSTALELLINNCSLREKISESAYKKVGKEYSVKIVFQKLINIWGILIHG